MDFKRLEEVEPMKNQTIKNYLLIFLIVFMIETVLMFII